MKKLFLLTTIALIANLTYAVWVKTSILAGKEVLCYTSIGTKYFVGTGTGGVYKSTNNGTTWTAANTGIEFLHISSLAVNGTNIFAGTTSGVFVSANDGGSWTAKNTGLTNTQVRSILITGTKFFVGTEAGVFLSENNGDSWAPVNTGLNTTGSIISLVKIGTNIFAASSTEGVFMSANNGDSWTEVNTGLTSTDVTSLAASGSNLFAGTIAGIFLSTNNGSNWTSVNTGLASTNVLSMAVSGTKVFAGTFNGGVFVSSNNGANWKVNNTGLSTNKTIVALGVIGTDIFASTENTDIWKRPLSEMTTNIQSVSSDNKVLSLYPNPNNGKFTLSSTANMEEIVIKNILGETVLEVSNLTNGIPQEIDLTPFNKGLYFITFRENDQEFVKKVSIY